METKRYQVSLIGGPYSGKGVMCQGEECIVLYTLNEIPIKCFVAGEEHNYIITSRPEEYAEHFTEHRYYRHPLNPLSYLHESLKGEKI